MAYTAPTVAQFKAYFVRDFPYGATTAAVMDQDILNAFSDTTIFMNVNLFDTQDSYTFGFLFLSAHFLVMNLRASSQGIAGQYAWLQNSKSVGSVSEGFNIPERIMANPEFAMLSKTYYGAKFLMFVLPQLTGNMFAAYGGTNP